MVRALVALRPAADTEDDFDVDDVIRQASLAEKISLLSGKDFWHTAPLPKYGVPSIRLSDGPNGVRGTKFFDGVSAACLPCGTGLAATWDRDLLYRAGQLIGDECIAKGAQCWLGPTVCIQRSPLGGRGFESLSEDPYATGTLAAAYIQGVQSKGITSTIKHWLANDQEHERVAVDVMVNQRTLREIHMLPFQIALRESSPGAVMACYNKVNGTHVSESKTLLDGVLRNEWGWQGLLMSDWFGTYSTSEALNAGLDLEMPGPTRQRGPLADLAVSSRKVKVATINARARNVLNFVKRASKVPVASVEGGLDRPEDRELNRKLAASSVVLLRNEANHLPLKPEDRKTIALIGPNMKTTAFCGGGSASLQPYYQVSPFEGIVSRLPPNTNVVYEVGAQAWDYIPLLGSNIVLTPEGAPGLRMRFYSEPSGTIGRQVIDETIIPESIWQLMGYSHPNLNSLFYSQVDAILVPTTTGNYKFGVAVYGAATLYIDDRIVIDNTTTQRGGTFFFGKGSIEETAIVSLVAGTLYRIRVEFASAPASRLIKPGVVNWGGGAARLGMIQVVDEMEAINRAADAAAKADIAILCGGLTRDQESEGWDRKDMDLPGYLPQLFEAVIAANPDTIVITQSGTPFNMLPWAEKVKSHLHAWFGGNETGNGIADVLFGSVNPCGKLPLSFPRALEDTPTYLNFGSERGRVDYGEGIYVGYRYYEKVVRNVLYPFGHGLSYTTFAYKNLQVSANSITVDICNTGKVSGAEVVQLYIAADPRTSSIGRPKKELKGFAKVYLEPQDSRCVTIPFDKHSFAFWDEVEEHWCCERGIYTVLVGSSSQDIRASGKFVLSETWTWTGL